MSDPSIKDIVYRMDSLQNQIDQMTDMFNKQTLICQQMMNSDPANMMDLQETVNKFNAELAEQSKQLEELKKVARSYV